MLIPILFFDLILEKIKNILNKATVLRSGEIWSDTVSYRHRFCKVYFRTCCKETFELKLYNSK